jgi:hypothetical protein
MMAEQSKLQGEKKMTAHAIPCSSSKAYPDFVEI